MEKFVVLWAHVLDSLRDREKSREEFDSFDNALNFAETKKITFPIVQIHRIEGLKSENVHSYLKGEIRKSL